MPVRGSNLIEEAERRKETILQKIKIVNDKSQISFDSNTSDDENSSNDGDDTPQICIKV